MNRIQPRTMDLILSVLFFLLLIVSFIGSPQGLMFPLIIGVYLLKKPLKDLFSRFPLPLAFIFSGLLAGLLIESFAILENLPLPAEKKVLLHPDPFIDILIALLWYGFFSLTWYLFLRKIAFSKKTVYALSALYGACTEFGVLALILSNPLFGTLLALIITAAYGIFPTVAYVLTEERFGERTHPVLKHYVYAILSLLLFWAVFGNLIYNPVISLFPKGF